MVKRKIEKKVGRKFNRDVFSEVGDGTMDSQGRKVIVCDNGTG